MNNQNNPCSARFLDGRFHILWIALLGWGAVGAALPVTARSQVANLHTPAIVQAESPAESPEPTAPEAYFEQGNDYLEQRAYDQAIAAFTQAIELQPDYAKAYYNRGNVYVHQSRYREAIADYTYAIQHQPGYIWAYNNRGIAYRNLEEYPQAIADYTQAIALKPDYADAYYNRGLAYRLQGNGAAAIDDFSKVIEMTQNIQLRRQAERQIRDMSSAIAFSRLQ